MKKDDNARLKREKETVETMIRLFCRQQHHQDNGLCPECRELLEYALKRVDSCKFGVQKPTCAKCPVHCYKPAMREKIIAVMRYSGPRMLLRHPLSAVRHLLDGLKK